MLDSSPEAIARRLTEAMEDAGVTNTQVAEACSVTVAGVGGWKKEGKIARDKIACVARQIKRTSDWLLTGTESPYASGRAAVDSMGHQFDPQDYSFVPRYESQSHAGAGGVVEQFEEVEKFLSFRTDWLRRKGLSAEHLATNIVRGNSMYPTLKDGDIVLTNRADRQIESGKIYSLNIDDRLLTKRLFILPDGALRISSDNKASPEYQDEIYPQERLKTLPINIIGRVVWSGGEL